MKISHAKARQLILNAADKIPNTAEHSALNDHLQNCRECAEYVDHLPQMEALLTRSLQLRWPEPYPSVAGLNLDFAHLDKLVKRKQRKVVFFGFVRGLAWAVLVLAALLGVGWAISNIRAQDSASLISQIGTPSPTAESTDLPVIGVEPVATQSSKDNEGSEQLQTAVPEFTPTASPTKFVGYEKVLSTTDLNCDGIEERITGKSGPELLYFDSDQWRVIKVETLSEQGPELIWEYTADGAGVGYLNYELFTIETCHKFLVLIGHKGWERIKVFIWDGQQMETVLDRPGTFFQPDTQSLSPKVFGIEVVPPNTFITYEFNSTAMDSKVVWTLWGYEWDGERLNLTIEERMEAQGGG